ncbi:MAG: YdcH family protein [Cellvibrionaceae bacterium]
MLGEDHNLIKEFPQLKDSIDQLNLSDDNFSIDYKRYNNLDSEIRKLELRDAPIDDTAMHELKRERSQLKDSLIQRASAVTK